MVSVDKSADVHSTSRGYEEFRDCSNPDSLNHSVNPIQACPEQAGLIREFLVDDGQPY